MNETELYKELGILTKDKERWEESIPYIASLLSHESVKIQAKALWLIGEMGLVYPESVKAAVPVIASFLDSKVSLLRERAVNALGKDSLSERIRPDGDPNKIVKMALTKMIMEKAADYPEPKPAFMQI